MTSEENSGCRYDRAKLLAVLKEDEAARRYLRFVLTNTDTETGARSPPRDTPASAVRKLESCGIFKLVNHRHVLADGTSSGELTLLLDLAADNRVLSIPDRQSNASSPISVRDQPAKIKTEWVATWTAVQAADRAVEYFAAQINPKVSGLAHVKRAILLSLLSAGDKYGDRGRIHVLMHGPPGTAKSALGNWCVHQLGIEGASHRTSIAGLTGDARGAEVVPGALPLADGGAIYIDELDKFSKKDLHGLLEAMEEGEVTINVGRIRTKLSARCRVIASANKRDKFLPELLDRFDFKLELKEPSKEEEQDISAVIAESWRRSKPAYYGDELRAYLQSIETYEPEITDEVHCQLRELLYYFAAVDATVRGSARKKEAVLRVSYALAKANRRAMTLEDALTALSYVNPAISVAQLEYLRSKALQQASTV
jgi:DNA replicative helicase MCM subunit Mcm2 (Cdc46/Mcm family)